ncbi:putative DHHC palmitoyltransferase [Trypanosoma vivax]|nr:putative DHHC palmitoyltransferase [Trypanosoma vivax]
MSVFVACMCISVAVCILVLLTFYRVVFTEAGYVSSDPWRYPPRYIGSNQNYKLAPANDAGDNPNTVKQLDRRGGLRFCSDCQIYKPDYAHHCVQCCRCTYFFDHHCPVLNNCIGRDNYKMFVLFLLHTGFGGIIHGIMIVVNLFVWDGSFNIIWLMVGIMFILISFPSLGFGLAHVTWLRRGESTMIRHVSRFQRPLSDEEVVERRQLYWNAVCGTDMRWWRLLLPLYPIRAEVGEAA